MSKKEAFLATYERLVSASEHLTSDERLALDAWERTRLDGHGNLATSDWPGWENVFNRAFH